MLIFLIFLFATIGATFIITGSDIFKKIREKINNINPILGKLINCNQCTGFYVALLIQLIILFKERMMFILYWSDLYYILYGFIGSFFCYFTYLIIEYIKSKKQ